MELPGSICTRRLFSLMAALLLFAPIGHAQGVAAAGTEGQQTAIPLWAGVAPGAQGTAPEDTPMLIPFLPARQRTSTAVLVIPGGGYAHLSLPTEGVEIAQALNAAGIPAFVLAYRLGPRYRYPAQLLDAQRAVRFIRARGGRFQVRRVGVAGFSAGGHLAAMLGTSAAAGDPSAADPLEKESARPDFMMLGYPVITNAGWAAEGSLRNIDPDTSHAVISMKPEMPAIPPMSQDSLRKLSADLHVSAETPPAFLVCANDDTSVSAENSARFYLALKRAGVQAELHIFAHGRHGFGLAAWDAVDRAWMPMFLDWLRSNDWLEPLKK